LDEKELRGLEKWFRGFVAGYGQMGPEARAILELKVEHTWRVVDNIYKLATEGSLSWADPWLARATGVLHDTGRFPQYQRYGTFRDPVSVNHGRLGADVIEESGVLRALRREDREVLLSAVRYHNAFRLPSLPEEYLRYLRLIRDADKLDVWRLLADYYGQPQGERLDVIVQGVDESPGCSAEVVEQLRAGRIVPNSKTRNLNDMRLHHVSWIYDINFPASCRLAIEAGDLQRIASGIPDSPGVSEAVGLAFRALESKAAATGPDEGQ
jgi:hypothetical protein